MRPAPVRGDAGPQAVSGVRGRAPGRAACRRRARAVRPQLLVPERLLEVRPQELGLGPKLAGTPVEAERGGEVCGRAAGGETYPWISHSAIGPSARRAVGVEDRVVRVLPALLDEAGRPLRARTRRSRRRSGRRPVDPGQRRFDVRPEVAGKLEIAGVAVVRAGQHHEQRRGVVAAVVAAERDLHRAPPSRRAGARAGSCPAGRRAQGRLGGLGGGEMLQHAAGERGLDPRSGAR